MKVSNNWNVHCCNCAACSEVCTEVTSFKVKASCNGIIVACNQELKEGIVGQGKVCGIAKGRKLKDVRSRQGCGMRGERHSEVESTICEKDGLQRNLQALSDAVQG